VIYLGSERNSGSSLLPVVLISLLALAPLYQIEELNVTVEITEMGYSMEEMEILYLANSTLIGDKLHLYGEIEILSVEDEKGEIQHQEEYTDRGLLLTYVFRKPLRSGEEYRVRVRYRNWGINKRGRSWVYDKTLSSGAPIHTLEVKVYLPKDFRVKVPDEIPPNYIGEENGKIALIWTTSLKTREEFVLRFEYSSEPSEKRNYLLYLTVTSLFTSVILSILLVREIYTSRRRKIKLMSIYRTLDEREREVLDFLRKMGETCQGEIGKALGIPKSSLSRTVSRLERKGLVRVNKRGKRKYLSLREDVVEDDEQQ